MEASCQHIRAQNFVGTHRAPARVMKIADWFKQEATEAAGELDQLAAESMENLERRKALAAIEDAFESMSADGEIDPKELAQLRAMMKEQKLDSSELSALYQELASTDGAVHLDQTKQLSDLFRSTMSDAKKNANEDEAFLNFRVQTASDNYTSNYEAASAAENAEHKALMNIIANMKA